MSLRSFFTCRINPGELSYDCALLIFPFLLEKIYDPLNGKSVCGMPFIWLFLMLAVYFLPLLIGRIYGNDFRDSSRAVKKFVIIILFTVTVFAYGNLVYLVMLHGDDTTGRGMFTVIASTVLLIMGPIAGLAFQGEHSRDNESNVQVIIFLFTIGLLPLFFMLITARDIFGDINEILLFFIVCGFCVLDVVLIMIIIAVYIALKRVLVNAGIYRRLAAVFSILVPFCVSFILVFFNIYTDRLFAGPGGIQGAGAVIPVVVMYIFSGVLPLRIIMMFAPPVRPLNVAMGILSAAVMIWFVTIR